MRDFLVRKLFEDVASGYDLQNSVLSLRIDVSWRKTLAGLIPADRPVLVLDAACGTGEVALSILARRPKARVLGVDFTLAMLEVAKAKASRRPQGDRLSLVLGDARHLPAADACADCLTIAFGIRNIEERVTALKEFWRVLKPGGQALVMEFSLPENPVMRRLYRLYFDYVMPPLGNWLSGTNYAYTYLMESVHAFPDPGAFAQEMREAGFNRVEVIPLTFGIARIHRGFKD
jgi:demethylmenaquinone methyltransferase/2-methoxy-6-polyprenyl-1,4-benzoquinol methylase